MTVSSVFSSDVVVPLRRPDPFVARHGDRGVVWLGGECDIATQGMITESLARAIAAGDGDLIVDLSGVTFIGTVTIDALVRTREILRRESRSVTVRSPSRCARRLLTLCGLADLIDPAGTRGPIDAA